MIDGNEIASKIKTLLKSDIEYLQRNFTAEHSASPKLGYVLVGNRPDSELYVRMK